MRLFKTERRASTEVTSIIFESMAHLIEKPAYGEILGDIGTRETYWILVDMSCAQPAMASNQY